MILNDLDIRRLCSNVDSPPMISPFYTRQVRHASGTGVPAISYGTSSFGYDLQLSPTGMKVFLSNTDDVIDPKNFRESDLYDISVQSDKTGTYYILPPFSYALGVTVETFNIPRNIVAICVGKSTYARSGLIVNTTPLEPGWRGKVVLEFANATSSPLKVYANEGIAQVVFLFGDEPETSYADRSGKYQDQEGIVTPKL